MDDYTHTNVTSNSTYTEETHIDKASLAMPILSLLFAFLFIVCLYYQPFRKCIKRGVRSIRRWDRLSRRKIWQSNRNLRDDRALFQEINNLPNGNTSELFDHDEVVSLSGSSLSCSSSSSSLSLSSSFVYCSSSDLEHASGSEISLILCPADESDADHDTDYESDYSGLTFNQVTWTSQETTLVNPAELPPASGDQIAEDSHGTAPNTSGNDDFDAVVLVTGPVFPAVRWGFRAHIREAHGPGAFVDRIVELAVQQFLGEVGDDMLQRHQPVRSDPVPSTEDDHEDTSLRHAADFA